MDADSSYARSCQFGCAAKPHAMIAIAGVVVSCEANHMKFMWCTMSSSEKVWPLSSRAWTMAENRSRPSPSRFAGICDRIQRVTSS